MESRRDKNVKLDLKLELQKPNINRFVYILFLGNVSPRGHFFFLLPIFNFFLPQCTLASLPPMGMRPKVLTTAAQNHCDQQLHRSEVPAGWVLSLAASQPRSPASMVLQLSPMQMTQNMPFPMRKICKL